MEKPNTKQIIRYLVIAYILYLIYSLPKTDWQKERVISETDGAGRTTRYAPGQSSYLKYIRAWWTQTMKTKGLSGIIDEHVLAPLGIELDNKDDKKG